MTGKLTPNQSITLEPGYRSDILIKAGQPGRYQLIDMECLQANCLSGPEDLHVLATIIVEGVPVDAELPASEDFNQFRAYKDITDAELVEDIQKVVFNIAGGRFTINNKQFDDPDAETRKLILGESQTWDLRSITGNHPFHIHVNPFEVIKRNDRGDIIDRFWKDTILVREGEPVEIRTRYTKYIGKFVIHCHILSHEDRGMMQVVEVVAPGDSRGGH